METVTPETYIRAESDRQFGVVARMTGGVNRFYHFRHPTPLDKQNIVRMNRDTLYSMAVVDTSQGATITVPKLTRQRFEAGLASGLDVANAEAQMATTASQIPSLEASARQAIYSLSVLLGRPPASLVQELKWDRSQFSELFRSMEEGLFIVDPTGRLLFVNPILRKRHGDFEPYQSCRNYFQMEGGFHGWDVQTGQVLQRLEHDSSVSEPVFSPDGQKLATVSDKTARIWDVQTGRELQRLEHNDHVFAAVFSPDGRKLATASIDNVALIRLEKSIITPEITPNKTARSWKTIPPVFGSV